MTSTNEDLLESIKTDVAVIKTEFVFLKEVLLKLEKSVLRFEGSISVIDKKLIDLDKKITHDIIHKSKYGVSYDSEDHEIHNYF